MSGVARRRPSRHLSRALFRGEHLVRRELTPSTQRRANSHSSRAVLIEPRLRADTSDAAPRIKSHCHSVAELRTEILVDAPRRGRRPGVRAADRMNQVLAALLVAEVIAPQVAWLLTLDCSARPLTVSRCNVAPLSTVAESGRQDGRRSEQADDAAFIAQPRLGSSASVARITPSISEWPPTNVGFRVAQKCYRPAAGAQLRAASAPPSASLDESLRAASIVAKMERRIQRALMHGTAHGTCSYFKRDARRARIGARFGCPSFRHKITNQIRLII